MANPPEPQSPKRRSLRILVAHNVPRGRSGGMNRTMEFLHDWVEAAGHQVEYFCSDDVPQSSSKMARFSFPLAVFRHAKMRRAEGRPYDIINVHEPSGAAVAVFKRQTGSRVVVMSYGVEWRGWKIARRHASLKSRILFPVTVLWQARWAIEKADHIFCKNEEDVAELVAHGIPRARITRIFPGADPIFGRSAATRDYSKAQTILFAATWIRRKGIYELVEAFTALAPNYPQLRLIVLNPGVDDAVVLSHFPPPLRDRISCMRAAPEEGVARVFEASDVYLLPSQFEGTPLTMMEAMWSGLPIVATKTCGMRDVLRDGDNGLLIPVEAPEALAKALERLLDDCDLRARLGIAAHEDAVTHYTWQKCAQAVIEAYERLAGC